MPAVESNIVGGYMRYEAFAKRDLIHFFETKLGIQLDVSDIKTDSYSGKYFYLLKR